MTRSLGTAARGASRHFTSLRLVAPGFVTALLLLACGDDGNPGTGDAGTTAGPTSPTADPTNVPTTSDGPDDTGGGMTAATGDDPMPTAPADECILDTDCPGGDNPCAAGRCTDGTCEQVPERAGTPQPDDPGNCMRAECDGMGAVHMVPDDDPPNDNPDDCESPTCQDGAVKLIPADDPPPDTLGDCKRTTCDAGEVVFVPDDADLPDDTIECTQDTCNGGIAEFPPKPANTLCGDQGDMFCHDDLDCEVCKQVDEACEDSTNTEPNDTQMTAFSFGTISDADSAGDTLCPVLDGPADVDWYYYFGDDKFPNVVDPDRVVTTDMTARLCVYFDCEGDNATTVTCNDDEVEDIAPGGQDGCCGVGSVAPTLNCSGLDDAANVWIKVENVDMLACVGYQLDYHF